MSNKPSCFVIIGYKTKPSYATGSLRLLDLDETFNTLIKPVFDELNIPCYRAIDKNTAGSIDKLMLQEIKNADIALADLSTLNANVMWELGVRHALKPKSTIMICEKEQMSSIPFDIGHFVVLQYTHTPDGIPNKIVEPFKKLLKDTVTKILNDHQIETDSPVFTFLENELGTNVLEKKFGAPNSVEEPSESFDSIMNQGESAKNNKEYDKAFNFYSRAKALALGNQTFRDNIPLIISRQALCTYKSKKPIERESYEKAKEILAELNPSQSNDVEVLGISGAIEKRLFELTGTEESLDRSIEFYKKGFALKQDYYNGINAAFMLYSKINLLRKENKDWDEVKTEADFTRNATLEISLNLEKEEGFSSNKENIWILLTIAEAFNYKGKTDLMKDYEEKAKIIAEKTNQWFALDSYEEQKTKIKALNLN